MLHFISNCRHAAGSLEISSVVFTTRMHIDHTYDWQCAFYSCVQLLKVIIGKGRLRP